MSRIDEVFQRCRSEKRAAFIPYLTGGDPDLELSSDAVASACIGARGNRRKLKGTMVTRAITA